MSESKEVKKVRNEFIKEESDGLRGSIHEEIQDKIAEGILSVVFLICVSFFCSSDAEIERTGLEVLFLDVGLFFLYALRLRPFIS